MMLKDLDESEKLKKVHIECLICKKNHKTMNCKSFQYYPNKIKIIKIYNKNDE